MPPAWPSADPGPDPDDVKALLVAAVLHRQRVARLRAVVCNGGMQPRARARLARCILDHVGLRDVPVGVGSEGKPYVAKPHEYAIPGFDEVDASRLLNGAALLAEVLRRARPRSLTVVCISSLRCARRERSGAALARAAMRGSQACLAGPHRRGARARARCPRA